MNYSSRVLTLIAVTVVAFVLIQRPQASYSQQPALTKFPSDLLLAANHNRNPIGPDGMFNFPDTTNTVVIDVGAHRLRASRRFLRQHKHIGVIAVEPLAERWSKWPNDKRLIALPFALNNLEGIQTFHVNQFDQTSSLAESIENSWAGDLTKTVEKRPVHVFKLSRVLEKIPERMKILLLKVDVQGRDLQVLRSAGKLLQRVRKVRTEVTLERAYKGQGDQTPGTQKEFVEHMGSHDFVLKKIVGRSRNGKYQDMVFINCKHIPHIADPTMRERCKAKGY